MSQLLSLFFILSLDGKNKFLLNELNFLFARPTARAPKHGYRTQTPNPNAGSLRLRDLNPTRLPALTPKISKRNGGVRMKIIETFSKSRSLASSNEIKNNEISWDIEHKLILNINHEIKKHESSCDIQQELLLSINH